MSRDSSSNNDLGWLANSALLSSTGALPNIPKGYESLGGTNPEPWESLTNVNQIKRNLNKNWVGKPPISRKSEGFLENNNLRNSTSTLDMTYLTPKECYSRDYSSQNTEDKMPSCWSYFDSPLPSNLKEMNFKLSSNNSLSSPSNLTENSLGSVMLNDSSSVGSLNQLFALNPDFSKLGDVYSCFPQMGSTYEDKRRAEKYATPMTPTSSVSPISPPTSSGTPPKLNTDLITLMQELALITSDEDPASKMHHQNFGMTPFHSPPQTPSTTPTKGCVFCKNNSYHSTFYKAHILKDDNGHCTCPVLRTYVCPLCGGTGDYAHTLKYCPRNTVTKGDPIAAGLPPGKVTNWREVATKMASQHKH